MNNTAHVTDMVNTLDIAVSAEAPVTARQALASFFDCDPSDVEAKLDGREPRLIAFGPLDTAEKLDRRLAVGQTIALYTKAVATGGVKGASRPGEEAAEDADLPEDAPVTDAELSSEAAAEETRELVGAAAAS